jgi:hypothetical protein
VPVLAVALAAGWLGLVFGDGLRTRALGGSAWYWCDFTVRGAAYVWGACESLAHYDGARRRVAIGLIEPAVARRFLFWGIAMAAVSGIFVNAAVASLVVTGAPPAAWYVIDGLLATIASGAMWITFFARSRRLSEASGAAPDPR